MIYILSDKNYKDAINLPCIKINFLKKDINFKNYDALIFSSKNGVKAIDKISNDWKSIPSYSIGSGTSSEIHKLGGEVVYEAKSSYGDSFAQEIKEKLKDKKVLFLRAKVVTSSLNIILRDAGVLLDEMIVYETLCSECDSLKAPMAGSYIIFSSPSTIECFFSCFDWNNSYKAIVIGKKTASFMPKGIPFVTSEKQTIDSCIDICKKLSKKAL
jgi:uroporphyrinogen-III synthase